MREWRSHDRNPRKKVFGNRGFGASDSGAFGYANRDAERYAVARSNTTGVYNSHYRGLRFRSTPGYFLEAHTRFSATAMAYLNRIARLVRPRKYH